MEQRRKRSIDEKSTHIKNRQRREQYERELRQLDDTIRTYTGPYGELGYYEDEGEDQ